MMTSAEMGIARESDRHYDALRKMSIRFKSSFFERLKTFLPVAGAVLAAVLLTNCGAPRIAPFMRPPTAPRGVTVEDNVAAARNAWKALADRDRRDAWPEARLAYNRALAAAFDDLRRADLDWTRAAAATGTRWETRTPESLDPHLMGAVFPASMVNVSRLGKRQQIAGVGLSLVGWLDESSELYQARPLTPPSGVPTIATALLRFDRGAVPTWEFIHPYDGKTVTIGGVKHPLKADFSAAHALYWRMSWLDKHKIANVLRPDRLEGVEGMFLARPLDRDRIPVVFVHGFNSSPGAFAPMINELIGEPWFRRNYQVWSFSYSTGVPWMLSASRYRGHFNAATEFARSRGVRNVDRTVVVGHSMGGLITNASLRDPGNVVYSNFADKPLEQLDLRPDERRLIRDIFLWDPLPQVKRAVFLATPHRGSPTADTWYSTFGSKLIKLPKKLTVDFADAMVRNASAIADPMVLSPEERLRHKNKGVRVPTVIESLSPNRPGIKILPQLPFRSGVHLHSVIGDRGRGDGANSSDGVVPYWSSHLPEAESELIVPADHAIVENPQAIAEVKRILQLHLRSGSR
jgi:pimeloyl-ACP methyl ester carboxylesterase